MNVKFTFQEDLFFAVSPLLEATDMVTHAFTTRLGGVSSPPYASLNMALHVGDLKKNVLVNRSLACSRLGIKPLDLVAGHQVHGNVPGLVTVKEKSRGAVDYNDVLPGIDALVTNALDVPLVGYFADCVPVFILEPVSRVIALAHAGWRGTVSGIITNTVKLMVETFGARPQASLAWLGPSIGPCCYQVGEEVASLVKGSISGWEDFLTIAEPGKWYFNLWEANRKNLLACGLKPANIVVSEVCTACNKNLFFSYRAEKGQTGRMAALLMLRGGN